MPDLPALSLLSGTSRYLGTPHLRVRHDSGASRNGEALSSIRLERFLEMKALVPLSSTANQIWRSSCTCVDRNNTQVFSLSSTFPSPFASSIHPLPYSSLQCHHYTHLRSLPYCIPTFLQHACFHHPSPCIRSRAAGFCRRRHFGFRGGCEDAE